MIDEAKRKAATANDTAGKTMDKLNEIRNEIDKISVTPGDSNLGNVLNEVDKSGEILKKMSLGTVFFFYFMVQNNLFFPSPSYLLLTVKDLLNTIPSLKDKISEVDTLTSKFTPISNITENIKKIKDLIEQARDAANRVRSCALNAFTL